MADDAGTESPDAGPSADDGQDESRNLAFTAILVVFALIGLGAVLVGFGGLFVVLTGGTADGGQPEIQQLAEADLQCDSFDDDPDVGHEGSVASVDQTGALLDDVNRIPDNDNLLIAMRGRVVDASAVQADGTPLNVTVGEDSAVVENGTTSPPYRVWIDSVDEQGAVQEGSVVRSQLDICP